MDSINELAAVSANRGRGWRVFAGVLLVGVATFAAAYYLPLYRAHAALTGKYKTLSQEATLQRKQLTETIDTLKQVEDERNQLSALSRKAKESAATVSTQFESLERELRKQLKKYIGPGKLQVERQNDKLHFKLDSPALVAPTGGALTEAGKSVVCIIGAGAKASNLGVRVHAPADPAAGKNEWLTPAVRAGNASQLLVTKCGFDSKLLSIGVSPATPKTEAALLIDIVPLQ